MRLTLRMLGLELLAIEASTDEVEAYDEPGDCTTYPVGFTRCEVPDEADLPDRG